MLETRGRTVVLVLLLLLAAAVTVCTGAQAATVFTDNFEAGITGWMEGGTPGLTANPAVGTYAVQLAKRQSIQRIIPTTGYDHLVVSFYLGTNSLWWSKSHLDVSWWDGTQWVLLKRIVQGDAETDSKLHFFQYALPTSADNLASFAIRVAMTSRSNGRDKGYFDDLTITADARSFPVTINKTGEGDVYLNDSPTPLSLPYTGTFVYGTELHLAAAPNTADGYRFGVWSGDLATMDNPVTLVVNSDKNILANFVTTEKILIVNGVGGTVSVDGSDPHPLPWAQVCAADASVTLEATAGPGHSFADWSGDISSTDNPVTVTMDSDKNITADFNVFSYTLSITGDGHGSIIVDGTTYALPWSGTFEYGATPLIEALPDDGYHFMYWTGDLTGSTNPIYLPITGDTSIMANFGSDDYLLSVTGTNGSITVNGVPKDLPYSDYFSSGETVSLGAVAADGYHFGAWSGDLAGSANPITFSMEGDMNVVANFVTGSQYVLNLTGTPGGSVMVGADLHTLPWSGVFDSGASVTLTPVPDDGYIFSGWSGDLSGSDNPATITMTGDKNIQAHFAVNTFTLSIAGTAGGSVLVNGDPKTLPWSGTFAPGTVVDVTAVPDATHTFMGWAGDLTGTDNPAHITMNSDLSITAQFAPIQYLLVLSGSGGNVKVNGESHALPWSGKFDPGAEVTLEAVPDNGDLFTGWSGDLTGTTNPATITMTGDTNIAAQFVSDLRTLTISATAGGTVSVNGTVQTLPWSGTFAPGTVVTLAATPSDGNVFSGWTGDVISPDATVQVTMNANVTVTAQFAPIQYTLTLSGTGGGSVSVNGTAYALPWSGTFPQGTEVTLAAAADGTHIFSGWSGDLTGTDNPVKITMSKDLAITAQFTMIQYKLTVTGNGGGGAKLDGVLQTLPTEAGYNAGTSAVVEAVADATHVFRGWSGDVTARTNAVTVTMDKSKSIAATFATIFVFTDIGADSWGAKEIAACYYEGIVAGYPDGTYGPSIEVSRDQMAVYMSRALAGGDSNVPDGPAKNSFPDVTQNYWAYKYVEYAKSHDIVNGYPDGTYQPSVPVTRGQMAVYVARSVANPLGDAGLSTYAPPTTPSFTDVPTTYWAFKYVEYCKALGIVKGYPDGYRPEVVVTRDQMAVYIQRAFQLPM